MNNKTNTFDLSLFEIYRGLLSKAYIKVWTFSLLIFLILATIYTLMNPTYYAGSIIVGKVFPTVSHASTLSKIDFLKENVFSILREKTITVLREKKQRSDYSGPVKFDDMVFDFTIPGNRTYQMFYNELNSNLDILADFAIESGFVSNKKDAYAFAEYNIHVKPVVTINVSDDESNVKPAARYSFTVHAEDREKIEYFIKNIMNHLNEKIRGGINEEYLEAFPELLRSIVVRHNSVLKDDNFNLTEIEKIQVKESFEIAQESEILDPLIEAGDFVEVLGTKGQFLLGSNILGQHLKILDKRNLDEFPGKLQINTLFDINEFTSLVKDLPTMSENYKVVSFSSENIRFEEINNPLYTFIFAFVFSIIFSIIFIIINLLYSREKEILKIESS